MKIVSWNVNSVRARLARLLAWLEKHEPDLLCLQETKVVDDDFPRLELEGLGYHLETFGQKTYNGVAFLSRQAPADVIRGLPGTREEARLIAGTFGDLRVVNAYVPNGSEVGSEKYTYKLEWLDRFREFLERDCAPEEPLLLCGDFNIAPEDRDVHDPERWRGKVLCSDPERGKFRALVEWGLVDALRLGTEAAGIYTWWDYRLSGFRRDWGLRIDHFLVTRPLIPRVRDVSVDREERGGEKPSDHAPLIARLD